MLGHTQRSPTTQMGRPECSPLSVPPLAAPTLMVSPWQEWQTGKHVQHSAVVGLELLTLKGGDAVFDPASRHRGSGPPREFSFPSDGG